MCWFGDVGSQARSCGVSGLLHKHTCCPGTTLACQQRDWPGMVVYQRWRGVPDERMCALLCQGLSHPAQCCAVLCCAVLVLWLQWMAAVDTIITKAGPGTIAEALISGLPILLNGNVPCQVGRSDHMRCMHLK